MASTSNSSTSSSASPLSLFDKEALVELIKEYFDVLNDKSTKFYASNRKAQAWQEISRKFCDSTGHQKTPLQLCKIWENIKARSNNDYSRHKAERVKTGGGKSPKPVDPLSQSILPLLDNELDPLCNTWYSDHGHHTVVENESDGSVTLSLSQLEDPVQEKILPQQVPYGSPAAPAQPVLHNGPGVPPQLVLHNGPGVPPQPVLHSNPTATMEQPVTPRPRKGHLVKKKLVQDAKQ
ncbi:uncharacterized protein LOC123515653 [Portunus trituberculatus]|uniref:uncharacterized protein LOC123515653 n=1 Tax=Portunus trituberculatus TaxID=210409 RepID=UPI001E1CE487|nr:uncharacterized protein LOC123515653 [Portunus trituberculatus]